MKLTTAARNRLPKKTFALPGKRAFPLPDASHARNALARAATQSPDVAAKVRAAVHAKYPNIGKSDGGMTGYANGGMVDSEPAMKEKISPMPPQTEMASKHCASCSCMGASPMDRGADGPPPDPKRRAKSQAMMRLMTSQYNDGGK